MNLENIEPEAIMDMLQQIGAAWIGGDFCSGVQIALKLGQAEGFLFSDGVEAFDVVEAVQGKLPSLDADEPHPLTVSPQNLKTTEEWLMACDRLALAVAGAKALGWEAMMHALSQHLTQCAATVRSNAKRLWMFAGKAAERLTFFGDHASAWSAIKPAWSYSASEARVLYRASLADTLERWSLGLLHDHDSSYLREVVMEAGIWKDAYHDYVLQHLRSDDGVHRIVVKILQAELLSCQVARTSEDLGPNTLVALVQTPHLGNRYRYELHRCFHEWRFALALVLLSGTEARPNAPQIFTQRHPSIERRILGLGDGVIELIWRQPTSLETLQTLRSALEPLQPGHPLAGDERTGATCLAAMRYLGDWDALYPIYALSRTDSANGGDVPDEETVSAWRTVATLFVECYNLVQALIAASSDDNESNSALTQATLSLLTGLRKPDVGSLCQAMGEAWVAEYVTGKPFGELRDTALPAIGEKT